MEIREVYYEVYFDGQQVYEGSFVECRDMCLQALDDDLAEMYKVTVTEQKVSI
jgi:hypothetical protein